MWHGSSTQVTIWRSMPDVEAGGEPLPAGQRLVLHYDHAREVEASLAFTSTHNPFTRAPKVNWRRLGFFKKVADVFALGEAYKDQAWGPNSFAKGCVRAPWIAGGRPCCSPLTLVNPPVTRTSKNCAK